jgi:hypothetical protein
MEIKITFKTSQKIHPKFQNLTIGKYTIEPLPSKSPNLTSATNNYLLRFNDEIREGEHMMNPKTEGMLFLSCLSLFLASRLQVESLMLNSINTPETNQMSVYNNYETTIENLPDMDMLIKKLMSKDSDIAKQFMRSCEVYRTAMNILGENNTLSYFLLTIAIECLSNKIMPNGGSCDKFVEFILKYLPDKSSLSSESDWREFLKEIYYNHRSGFTHGGKDIPDAVLLADRLNRTYVKNVIDGKEVRTPGLKWFESVVRQTLVGFLNSTDNDTGKIVDYFKEFSLESGRVNIKAKVPLKANQFVTTKDVDLD